MTRWRQGKRDEARTCFNRAVDWIVRNKKSTDVELRRFHAEAAALLGLPGPDAKTGAVAGEGPRKRDKKATETAHRKGDQADPHPLETNKSPET
jgi:hypothetical protein